MTREENIIWAAGFLEGEGHFGWWGVKNKGGYKLKGYPLVAAAQTQRWPLDRLAEIFDGTVRLAGITKTGREHWEWRLTNAKAIDVMVEIYLFMSPRAQDEIRELIARYAERTAATVNEWLARQEACPSGHLRSEHSVRRQSGINKGQWYCRECSRLAAAAKRERMKGVPNA